MLKKIIACTAIYYPGSALLSLRGNSYDDSGITQDLKRRPIMWNKFFIITFLVFSVIQGCSNKGTFQEFSDSELLGDLCQISLSCDNLEESLSFYQKLHFSILTIHTEATVPWALISDGTQLYMLSEHDFPSPSLTFYGPSLPERIKKFRESGIKFEPIYNQKKQMTSAVLTQPAELNVTLINYDSDLISKPQKHSEFFLGSFDQIRIPTRDITQSGVFWKKLGFTVQDNEGIVTEVTYVHHTGLQLGFFPDSLSRKPVIIYKSYINSIDSLAGKIRNTNLDFEMLNLADQRGIKIESPDQQLFFIFSPKPESTGS